MALSTRLRLALRMGGLMAVLLLLHAGLSIGYVWSRASAATDRTLHVDFDMATLSLRWVEDEFVWAEPPARDLTAYDELPAIDVWSPSGQRMFAIAGWDVRLLPEWKVGQFGLSDINVNGTQVRVLTAKLQVEGHDVVLRVARATPFISDDLRSLARALAFASLGSFIVLALGAWAFARRTMAPLRDFVARARTISAGNLHERLMVPNTGDEWQQLAITFNAAIARLEGAFIHLETFTANVAHELRTPLTAMRSATEVALRAPDTELRVALESILEQIERLGALVDRLLMLARVDAGGITITRVSTDLHELIAEVTEWMRPLADERHQTIELAAGPPCFAIVDRALMAQAALDLLDNAIRYAPENSRIDVDVRLVGQLVIVTVADRGPGLTPDQCEAAFERLWRADTSRSSGGLGLGLSIVLALARAQGGDAKLEPRDGGGLKASVLMPASAAVATR